MVKDFPRNKTVAYMEILLFLHNINLRKYNNFQCGDTTQKHRCRCQSNTTEIMQGVEPDFNTSQWNASLCRF